MFFADIPYDIQLSDEKYYQTIFCLVFRIVGLDVDCEVRTEAGKIDAVVKTAARIFVFEFKLQGTAQEAIQQIHQRRYHEKYAANGREVLLVGARRSTPRPATSSIGWSSDCSGPWPPHRPTALAHQCEEKQQATFARQSL